MAFAIFYMQRDLAAVRGWANGLAKCLWWMKSNYLLAATRISWTLLVVPRSLSVAMSPNSSPKSRLVFGPDDALFGTIEAQHQNRPFGSVLDAGTGVHSLRWIATLVDKGMTDFTAITADESMRRQVQFEAEELAVDRCGTILVGNWFDEKNPLDLGQETYDTIIADYLIGAMDGFSPYKQDLVIDKLAKLLRPKGRLYVVGLEPIPDAVPGDANVICRTCHVRDACILLAGNRCYREFPLWWVERQIEQCNLLHVLQSSQHSILYRHETIVKQINVARSKLPFFPNAELRAAMAHVLDELETQSKDATERAGGRLALGFDYVVSAERV